MSGSTAARPRVQTAPLLPTINEKEPTPEKPDLTPSTSGTATPVKPDLAPPVAVKCGPWWRTVVIPAADQTLDAAEVEACIPRTRLPPSRWGRKKSRRRVAPSPVAIECLALGEPSLKGVTCPPRVLADAAAAFRRAGYPPRVAQAAAVSGNGDVRVAVARLGQATAHVGHVDARKAEIYSTAVGVEPRMGCMKAELASPETLGSGVVRTVAARVINAHPECVLCDPVALCRAARADAARRQHQGHPPCRPNDPEAAACYLCRQDAWEREEAEHAAHDPEAPAKWPDCALCAQALKKIEDARNAAAHLKKLFKDEKKRRLRELAVARANCPQCKKMRDGVKGVLAMAGVKTKPTSKATTPHCTTHNDDWRSSWSRGQGGCYAGQGSNSSGGRSSGGGSSGGGGITYGYRGGMGFDSNVGWMASDSGGGGGCSSSSDSYSGGGSSSSGGDSGGCSSSGW